MAVSGAFPKAVKIVAQKETAEILAQRKDPRRPVPSITFRDTYELNLGGQTLILDYRDCPNGGRLCTSHAI